MSRIAYLDLIGGAAGDMLLCALLDAGESIDPGMSRHVLDELARLPLAHRGARLEEVTRAGIRALRLVDPPGPTPDAQAADVTGGVGAPGFATHSGPTRTLGELHALLDQAGLSPLVRNGAGNVFDLLASAEARVHGRPVQEIRLHEAGADDAVFDVVGVCLALEALGVERVESSAVPFGGRSPDEPVVDGAPGVRQGSPPLVPAPATVEMLRGCVVSGPPPWDEATTPTGAALVSTLVAGFGPPPSMQVAAVGYGAGTRDPAGIPNVVRVLVGEPAPQPSTGFATDAASAPGQLVVLEANLDDLSPQLVADAAAALLDAGALDSWVIPVVMKKGRPGFVLGALAAPDQVDALRGVFFEATTTLGVRAHRVDRTALERRIDTVTVSGWPVRIKVGLLEGAAVTATPEHDDLASLARATGRSVRSLEDEARATWSAGYDGRADRSGHFDPGSGSGNAS